jgi:hypothetical protein
MSYNPNEVALLRQLIVQEQQSMKKRRGKGKVQEDMEGGSLFSLASAFARAVVPAVSKVASTASRGVRSILPARSTSTAIVRYNPAQAKLAQAAARSTAPSMGSRLSSSLGTLGNVASFGLPVGFTAYQAVDYEKQKKIQEGVDAETARQNELAVADNKRLVDKEVEFLLAQQKLVEADRAAVLKAEADRVAMFNLEMTQIEEDRLKQEALNKKYEEEAERQYQEMLAFNDKLIREQIRLQMEAFQPSYNKPSKQPPLVVPPSTTTQPYVPTEPSQSSTNPAVDPTAGMSAKQRVAYYNQLKQGKGRHVDFLEGGGNAWIEALKDWNDAERHRGEMWCIPKKGSKQFNKVKKVMEIVKKGQKHPILAPQTKKTRSKKVKAVEKGQTLLSFGEKK